MSQVSYGTITITDTTDIERIYPVYCKGGESQAPNLTPLSNWSENVSQAGGTGDYIWQRIVTKKQGIAVTAADYSDAVRLTGDDGTALTITSTQYAQTQNETDTPSYGNSMPSPINEGWWLWVKVNYNDGSSVVTKIKQGQKGDIGISVTGTKEIYFLKRTTDSVPTAPGDGVTTTSTSTAGGVWTTVVPDYVAGGVYYTSIQTSYSSGTSPKSSPAVINQGLTDANAKALDAYNTSTARDTEINAIKAQAKYYWWDSEGAHVAAGLTNIDSDSNINHLQPSSFGFNSLMSPGALKLRYKDINFAQLATNSLTFYRPATNGSTYVQGKKGMDLTADALTFYKPLAYNSSNEPTAAATLNSTNGLILSEGGIKSGDVNAGNSGFIYLSTKNYGSNLTINSHQASNWREVIGTKFGVDADGNLYASSATISGAITATSLTLSSGVQIPASTGISGLSTVATSGSYNDLSNKPTIPSLTGYIYQDGTVGTTPADGATGFVVSSSGLLTASNAVIYGSIYASKGYIGGWQIGTDGNKTLHNGSANTSPTIGNNTIILSKGLTSTTSIAGSTGQQTWTIAVGTNFGVTTAGKLYATGADIAGEITATSGTIGNTTSNNITISANTTNAAIYSKSHSTLASTGDGFYLGSDGISIGSKFKYTGGTTNTLTLDTITATNFAFNSGSISGTVTIGGTSGPAASTVANNGYSVEIQVTAIDYVNNSATLVAIPYYQGGSILSGVTITYQWYKNGTILSDTSTEPTISGATTNTLVLGEGTDFGSSSTNAIYTCVIS